MKQKDRKGPRMVYHGRERSRRYYYSSGARLEFRHIISSSISEGGEHRLETAGGRKFTIPVGWICLEVDGNNWTL